MDGKLNKQEFSKFYKSLLTNALNSLTNNSIDDSINLKNEINMKILLLGLDSCGKTTIYKKLMKDDSYYDYITTYPTEEINSNNINYKTMSYNLIDIGGTKKYREQWKILYNDVDVVIWVIDSSDNRRIAETKQELNVILSLTKKLPILFCLNKIDKVNSIKKDELIPLLKLSTIDDRYYELLETSAKQGNGLEFIQEWI